MLLEPQTPAAASKVVLLCFGFSILSFRSWSCVYAVLICFVLSHLRGVHDTSFILLCLIAVARVGEKWLRALSNSRCWWLLPIISHIDTVVLVLKYTGMRHQVLCFFRETSNYFCCTLRPC